MDSMVKTSIRIGPKKPVRVFIRERREAAGLTQTQLASRLGVEPGTVSRWEATSKKRRIPSSDVLAAIAEALNIHVSLLFSPPSLNYISQQLQALPDHDRELVKVMIDAAIRHTGTRR